MHHSIRLGFALAATLLLAGMAGTRTSMYAQGPGQAGQDQNGQALPPVFNPYLPPPYRLVPNWPPPDPNVKWGSVIQEEPDALGNIWVVHRGSPPILKMDPETGKVLAGFGAGMFASLHGFTLDSEGNIYVTDCPQTAPEQEAAIKAGKAYQLVKMSPEGKVLMTIGKPGVSKAGPDTLVCPTDVAVAANGDIFITDGHDPTPAHYGDRIARFSKDGKFIRDIARSGTGPGEVWQPHSIAIDSQGRLFIADRSNNRLEVLDQDGNFIDIWRQFSRPSGIFIDKRTDTIYVSDSESGPRNHPDWPKGIRIGSARTGAVMYFISGTNPEGVGIDLKGNVYACIGTRGVLEKYEKLAK